MSSVKAQLAAAEARYRRLQARSRELDGKRETRRKIIYGAAFLSMIGQLAPGLRANILARVHQHVVRDADRASLDLPPLPAPKGQAPKPKAPARVEVKDDDGGQELLPM